MPISPNISNTSATSGTPCLPIANTLRRFKHAMSGLVPNMQLGARFAELRVRLGRPSTANNMQISRTRDIAVRNANNAEMRAKLGDLKYDPLVKCWGRIFKGESVDQRLRRLSKEANVRGAGDNLLNCFIPGVANKGTRGRDMLRGLVAGLRSAVDSKADVLNANEKAAFATLMLKQADDGTETMSDTDKKELIGLWSRDLLNTPMFKTTNANTPDTQWVCLRTLGDELGFANVESAHLLAKDETSTDELDRTDFGEKMGRVLDGVKLIVEMAESLLNKPNANSEANAGATNSTTPKVTIPPPDVLPPFTWIATAETDFIVEIAKQLPWLNPTT
jgi:hypothetical protein